MLLRRSTRHLVLCLVYLLVSPTDAAEPRGIEGLVREKIPAGVVVCVDPRDTTMLCDIAQAGEYIVLGVVEDEQSAAAIREDLARRKLLGRVTVAVVQGPRLPLVGNSVAILLAHANKGGPRFSRAEMLRVVRPRGILSLQESSRWTVHRKQLPQGTDDWPQYFHDGAATDYSKDELVGPARGLQWETGDDDLYAAQMGCRLIDGILVKAERQRRLVARDAFSGAPLWRRDDLEVANRYALLVDSQRVYCHPLAPGHRQIQPHMIALDIHTGETVCEYDQGFAVEYEKEREGFFRPKDQSRTPAFDDLIVRLSDGVLVQVESGGLWALDANSGKLLWKAAVAKEGNRWMHPAAVDGRLFVMEGEVTRSFSYTHWPMATCQRIVAFDLRSGKQAWQWTWPAEWGEAGSAYNMVFGEGKLALPLRQGRDSGEIHVLTIDATDGQTLAHVPGPWREHGGKIGWIGGGHSHVRAMIRNGRLWLSRIGGTFALDLDDPATIVLDLHGGLRPIGCTVWRTTPNFMLGSLTAVNPEGAGFFHTNAARTVCDVGAFPANGLMYLTPNNCGCLSYIPASNAFHSEKPRPPDNFSRLQRGTARAASVPTGKWPAENEWPMFMHDPRRSNWTDQQVSSSPKLQWTARIASPPQDETAPMLACDAADHPFVESVATAVTVAEGVCLAAVPHEHAVVALDAKSGELRWRIVVDGRVDSPPTIYRGLALFGTRNGWVYAVNRDTGELVWRFFAAPHDQRIVANGQLESTWPLFGTVMIEDGAAWAFAGRNVDLDGGIYWHKLDPATGKTLAQGRLGFDELLREGKTEADRRSRTLGSNMPPVSDGRYLVFHNFIFDTASGTSTNHSPWDAHRLDVLTPSHLGLVNGARKQVALNAHSHCYGVTRGWMIACHDRDYVAILGSTERGNRGGGADALALRLRRHPDDKTGDPKKLPPEVVWKYLRPDNYWGRGGYYGVKAVAKAGDKVLVVASPEGHDGWQDREKNIHALLVIDYATGKELGNAFANEKRGYRAAALLPNNGIYAGIAVAYGRIYLTCRDGTICCLE